MSFNISEHLPEDFAPNSRVWIYQCNRIFFMQEALDMEPMFTEFVASWNSHGTPVKGYANLFFGRFIILMADENATGVSGCSTDSSVHLIQSIEEKFSVNMFDRTLLSFYINDKVEQLPISQLSYAIENKFIKPSTLYFDNTVLTKIILENNFFLRTKKLSLQPLLK